MRPMKRMDSTLAPIPAKSSRLMSTTTTAANTTNRPPRIGTNNSITAANANTTIKRTVGQTTKPTATRPAANSASTTGAKKTATSTASSSSTSVSTTGAGKPINKRIPPYDFKARYNDLLEKYKVLKEKYEDKCEQMGTLENLPEQLEDTQNQLISVQGELKNTQTIKGCLEEQVKFQNEKIETIEASLSKTMEELEKLTKVYNVSIEFYKFFRK